MMVLEDFPCASSTSLAIALASVLLTIVYWATKWRGLPPGPVGLPFFGIWPFLDDDTCNVKLGEYKKKYGDVYSFTICGRLYINLGSAKAIREAHITKSDSFDARISDFSLMSSFYHDSIPFSNGEPWKDRKKFFLQVLKERGILTINDNVSASIYDSLQTILDVLKSKQEEPLNITELVMKECITIMRQTLFGESGTTDEKINEINEYYATVTAPMTPVNLLLSGKIAEYLICPFYSSYRTGKKNLKYIESSIYQMIQEHKSTYDEEHIRDIIDEFLKEKNDRQRKGDPTVQHFTDKALIGAVLQFVGDGVLMVAAFIMLFLKATVNHPADQERMYQEILDVVGTDRLPTIEDKPSLIYTNAFILEVLRTFEVLPFFPSLECTKETTLNGYRIPTGSITLMNFWCAHYDPIEYEDPEKFNPSRFITSEGKRRPEPPVTFGMGKRSCIGEGFAMMQVFLFITAIIQNFRLTLAEGNVDGSALELLLSWRLMVQAIPRTEQPVKM